MDKRYIKIAFVFIAVLTVLILLSLSVNKPYIVKEFSADRNTFVSGNFNLSFNYPKNMGNPKVDFPTTFDNEVVNFSNGLTISYWQFEGFFGPYETSEELKSKDGKSCNLYTLKQGVFNEENGIFAQCHIRGSDFQAVTFIWQGLSDEELLKSLPVIRSIVSSLEYNTSLKILNLF